MFKKRKTGIDIISRRFSSFEKQVLMDSINFKKDDLIYDLGSGQAYFSLVLAFLGKKIFTIDKHFEKLSFWKILIVKKLFSLNNIFIEKRDISKMNYKDFQDDISLVYSGRFLHYLEYSDAEKLLKILSKKMNKKGKIYFSISGIKTGLAKNYKGINVNIEKRFFYIDKNLQERFKIKNQVCLYSKNEVEKLFSKFFDILEIKETKFFNITVIAQSKKL